MKDSTQLLHEVRMQILDIQIATILAQSRHKIAAILEGDEEVKAIHLSHAAAQTDIIAMLDKLLLTAKGE